MKNKLLFTYGLLILLTVSTALISNTIAISSVAIGLILGIAAIKFLLVSFEFMELKKANSFWKASLISVLGLLLLVLVLLK
jgi:predicted transporter